MFVQWYLFQRVSQVTCSFTTSYRQAAILHNNQVQMFQSNLSLSYLDKVDEKLNVIHQIRKFNTKSLQLLERSTSLYTINWDTLVDICLCMTHELLLFCSRF